MANKFNIICASIFILLAVIDKKNVYGMRRASPNTNVFKKPSSISWKSQNRAAMCLKGDCYPETGDLLVGRTKFLHASSTCGLEERGPERYCVLGTRDSNVCDYCDSSEPYDPSRNITNSHMIENIVSRKQGDRFNRWWQSQNGKQNVYIQFDLEAEFAFTHIIMTFKTFRPAAMVIEKSSDFGRTWKAYGYFASNCAQSFPEISDELPRNLGDLYCESRYSSVEPSTRGEVVFRILPPTLIQSKDPYSNDVQDLLKITNLRINFTKLHTFGDNLFDSHNDLKSDILKEKYYYSMYEMVVRGSCLCYGHASQCIPVEGVQYDKENNGMVEGQCQCKHNTMGTNCEECLPLFNDRPWKPARKGNTHECKMCNCHSHASTCTFNSTLYEESGEVSGGVCNDCQHNTRGINCEKCKENFWRDPERGIDDLYTCKPCLCDLSGSLNDAKCDPYTDEEAGLVAGKCHCKSLVEGQNCDRCMNGYYNLTSENPEGCQPCSCNTIGTTDNMGCDKSSGLCSCKKFVTGRACDQCLPGYYGLSDGPDGCKPCDCALGGSEDMFCDSETGQCKCKRNMSGRTCSQPKDGFFCPLLDYFSYEAEHAKIDSRSVNVKEPISNRKNWTGTGFVRAFESTVLEFNINDKRMQPFKNGFYDVVIRYRLMNAIGWNDIRVVIDREIPMGFCAGSPADLNLAHRIEPQTTYSIVRPPLCLEAGQNLKISLIIEPQGAGLGREASILIDSILLVPIVDELPSLQGPNFAELRDEFEYYNCRRSQLDIYEDIRPECEKFLCNIGIHNEGFAQPCECDATGSTSSVCDWKGGKCECRPNVDGRRCSECAVSTYGFSSKGCQSCNCNSGGAMDDFCDIETGQCECYVKVAQVKLCDKCKLNFWNFPSCKPCHCNKFADFCNQTTGECIDCKFNTYGHDCENVKDGYYWPSGRLVPGEKPKQCQCPGSPSGNQFANTCYFDQRIDGIICDCQDGYVGYRCDQCDVNYYGSPTERGGSCQMCECNGNTNIDDRDSCDQVTGVCKKCRFNTDGDKCEKCLPGYFGNALNHDCKPCNCYTPGTEGNSALNCDQTTGLCNCLPNVSGKQCDLCEEDHFGLHRGTGCDKCDCDLVGTFNSTKTCDKNTGQCTCLDSRGGRTCSDCKDDYWGNPNIECNRCECTPHGSEMSQCDKNNGSCVCKKGITGYNCDRCDRGTTGNIPYCTPCGECFDDWNNIVQNIGSELETLEIRASNLAVASGSNIKDFSSEYNQVNGRLNEIKQILNVDSPDNQLIALQIQVDRIQSNLAEEIERKQEYQDLEKWDTQNKNIRDELASSIANHTEMKNKIKEYHVQTVELIESNKQGAFESIQNAAGMSDSATLSLDRSEREIQSELKPLREDLQQKIDNFNSKYAEKYEELHTYSNDLMKNLTDVLSGVFGVNKAVCGAEISAAEPCDLTCGGSGCKGQCGTNSSQCEGLMDTYWKIVDVRKQFLDLYKTKENEFKDILTMLHGSSRRLNSVNEMIEKIMFNTNSSLNSINKDIEKITSLSNEVDDFSKENLEKPSEIESTCKSAIDAGLKYDERSFKDILEKISELASKTSNVNDIDEIRRTKLESENTIGLVRAATESQKGYLLSLNKTKAEYGVQEVKLNTLKNSKSDLTKVINDIDLSVTKSEANNTAVRNSLADVEESIDDLQKQLNLDLKEMKHPSNIPKQESLKSKVKQSGVTLSRTKTNLEKLEDNYNKLFEIFTAQAGDNPDVLNNLIDLQVKINEKKKQVDQKSSRIKSLSNSYKDSKARIKDLKLTLDELKIDAQKIRDDISTKEQYFSQCG